MSPVIWVLIAFDTIGVGIGVAFMITSKQRFGVWIP